MWNQIAWFLFHFHSMKQFILFIIAVLVLGMVTPKAQALFGHVAAEKERRQHAEQQFAQEQLTNARLYVAVGILSAGITVALVIGAAVGSKTRRDT